MNREELIESITTIGTCEDDSERRNLLTTLSENVSKVFDEVDSLKTTNSTLEDNIKDITEKNEKLQSYNMEMFLKLNAEKQEKPMEQETGIKEEEKPTYKSYSDLAKGFMK